MEDSAQVATRRDFDIKKLFVGRIGRRHFLSLLCLGFLTNILLKVFLSQVVFITVILSLAVVALIVAIIIRRLHDINLSGYWSLVYIVTQHSLPFLVAMLSIVDGFMQNALVAILTLDVLVWIPFMLYLVLRPGNPAPNRFGVPYPSNTNWITALLNQQ